MSSMNFNTIKTTLFSSCTCIFKKLYYLIYFLLFYHSCFFYLFCI